MIMLTLRKLMIIREIIAFQKIIKITLILKAIMTDL